MNSLRKYLPWRRSRNDAPPGTPDTIFMPACQPDQLAYESQRPPHLDGGIGPRPSSGGTINDSAATSSTTKRFALLVGINSYGGDNNLRGCLNDVRNWKNLFIEDGISPSCIRIITDRAATRDNVLAGIQWLVADRGADDLLIFTFSGHGSWTLTPTGHGWECCICCCDCFEDWDSGVISRTDLKNTICRKDGRLLVILDSCFSGGMSPSYRKCKHLPRKVRRILNGPDLPRTPGEDLRAALGPCWLPLRTAAVEMGVSPRWVRSEIAGGRMPSRLSMRNSPYVQLERH